MASANEEGLGARWERLSERERMLFGLLATAFVLLLIALATIFVGNQLSDIGARNSEMQQAIDDIKNNRDNYLKAHSKSSQLESRIGHGGVQLEGLLESAAAQSDGLLIAEQNERQPVQLKGSKFIERAVDVRIRSCRLGQLSNFLRKIETGPNLVAVTGLKVRTRDDKHEDLEVELTVSTWERAPDKQGQKKPAAQPAEGGGGKEGKG